ncbi:SDR family oxidoreductase [Caldibacillus lycopersici]|uniref:dTDP-4-dehydrorhamnose reductase n=1 Tax=Perspicuibacillus lycopersici TaxID=1325689 RepID=A0AAE3ITX4_9BACI|nr:SDR family oxidoreductase [Perspicuibacillus lycopersici]MCU9614555.1 SDR family oxidoreductase [Perspicuibacillus lycopersici]
MKLLILGGKGMAGHMLVSYFKRKPEYIVYYTSRNRQEKDREAIYLDATDQQIVEDTVDELKPDIIINCIGILNDKAENNPPLAFQMNSVLPHQLAKLAERNEGKLIHISTDCVFSGSKGSYTESDPPDGTSVYAKTKRMGEVVDHKHLTIRTSIIGPELKEDGIGLFLWFMKQKGQIKGYQKALWNGVTTLELAKAVDSMIKEKVTGLYHLGMEKKISKLDLLLLIKRIFQKEEIEIIPDDQIVVDRTIKNTRTDFVYRLPNYERMVMELKDWMDHDEWSS